MVSTHNKMSKGLLKFSSILNLISLLALAVSPFVIPQKALAAASDNYRWVAHNTGISGSDIAGIAIDPNTPTTIYALTGSKGVYKSTNGGSSWTAKNTGFPSNMAVRWANLFGNLLTMDPNNPNVLYTNIGGKVYKTTDGAENWSESNTGITACAPSYQIAGVIVDPQDSNHLFAAHIASGCSGGVYESTDAGANWTRTANSGIGNDEWTLAIDPTNNQRLYSGTIYIGFAYSTDGGHHWTQNKPSGASESSYTVAVHPSSTNRILLAADNGLFLSDDYGITWTSLISQVSGTVYDIRFAPSNSDIGYAVGVNGIFKTTDGGLSWLVVGSHAGKSPESIAIHPTDQNTIYVGSAGSGIYKSTDGGINLTQINTGLPTTITVDRTLATDTATDTIFAGVTGQGLYQSTDSGETWQFLDSAMYVNGITFKGNTVFHVGTNVRRSTDGGSNWSTVYTPSSGYIWGIAIDPNDSQVIYMGTTAGSKMFKSTDGGDTWTQVGILGGYPRDIKVDPLDSNLVYVATNDYFWKSANGGQNWTRVTSGLTGSTTRYLTLHTDGNTTLYLTTQEAGVYKSTDQGNSWTKFSGLTSSGRVYTDLVVDYANSNNLYVSEAYTGVYKSTDGGSSWSLMNTTGFPSSDYPFPLCQDPADSSRLLLGFYVYGGIYAYENYTPVFSTSSITVADDNGGQVVPGDTLTYTVTVTNSGWADGNDTTLTASIPSGLTYVANSTTRDGSIVSPDPVSGGTLSLSIGDLSKDDSIGVTYQVTVDSDVTYNSIINHSGTITSDEDTEGTSTGTASVTIGDETAPSSGTISINSGDSYTTEQTVTLNISATDVLSGVSQMMISENSDFSGASWETYSTSKSFTLSSGDGTKTVYIKFKDTAGNQSSSYSDSINYDATSPSSGVISINSGASYTTSREVTLTISADGAGEMKVSENSDFSGASWETYSTSKSLTLSSGDGTKTVYIKFKDASGNESSSYSDSITLDETAPTAGSILVNSGDTYTTSRSVTLTISATDATSDLYQMVVSEDSDFSGASWEDYAVSRSFNLSYGDGTKTIYIKFKDNAGMTSSSYSDDIIFDSTAPSTPVLTNLGTLTFDSSHTNWYYTGTKPIFKGTAEAESTVTITISSDTIEGTTTTNSSGNWEYTPASNLVTETHQISIKAKDTAGNESNTLSFNLAIDLTASSFPQAIKDLISEPEIVKEEEVEEVEEATPSAAPLAERAAPPSKFSEEEEVGFVSIPLWAWGGLGIIIGLLILALFLIYRRRRHQSSAT